MSIKLDDYVFQSNLGTNSSYNCARHYLSRSLKNLKPHKTKKRKIKNFIKQNFYHLPLNHTRKTLDEIIDESFIVLQKVINKEISEYDSYAAIETILRELYLAGYKMRIGFGYCYDPDLMEIETAIFLNHFINGKTRRGKEISQLLERALKETIGKYSEKATTKNIEHDIKKFKNDINYQDKEELLFNITNAVSALYTILRVEDTTEDDKLVSLIFTSVLFFLMFDLISLKQAPADLYYRLAYCYAISSHCYTILDGENTTKLSKEKYEEVTEIDCLAMNLFALTVKITSHTSITEPHQLSCFILERINEISKRGKFTENLINTNPEVYQDFSKFIDKAWESDFIKGFAEFDASEYLGKLY